MNSKKIIILLSGEKASGKSTICEGLKNEHGFTILNTRTALERAAEKKLKGKAADTGFLQKLGRQLDKDTKGRWVIDEMQTEIQKHDRILIDSVRISEQIDAFRNAYGIAVVHIHLHAPEEWRLQHFIERAKASDFKQKAQAKKKFQEYSEDPTEKKVFQLREKADLVIYTADSSGVKDQVVRAASFLRLLPPIDFKNVDVVVGGQFGSEGKGQIAAYMAPEYDCLVRVGGPNAGHKVYNEPEPDVFHIIPSGSVKAQNALIVIGPGCLICDFIWHFFCKPKIFFRRKN